jgi:hypothetical protein
MKGGKVVSPTHRPPLPLIIIGYYLGQRGHMAMVGRTVYVPPLPCDLAVLLARIIAAVKNIDATMLARVWQELEYRIDVCRVTRGAHIEDL